LANEREAVLLKAVVNGARSLLTQELDDSELSDQASRVVKTERDHRMCTIKAEIKRLETERLEVLDSIKDLLEKYVFGQATRQLTSYLSIEHDTASRRLVRFVRAGGARPTSLVAKRFGTVITRRFRTHFSRWADQNEQWLVHRINASTAEGLHKLRRNLNDLAVLPRKAFGLAIAEPASVHEEDGTLSLQPQFEIDLVDGWNPRLPGCLRFLPTFMTRRWLRNRLQRELVTFISKQQVGALNVIWSQLENILRAYSARVAELAANLESRAMMVFSGGPDHGKEGFRDENVPSYRDQLVAMYNNFSLIRQQIHSSLNDLPGASFGATRPIPIPSFDTKFDLPDRSAVRSDFTTRGCAVCDRLVKLSKEFFVKFQYALYNDGREQESFAKNRGFCPFHTWQLEAVSYPVGFSVGCARLVRRIADSLSQMGSSPKNVSENLAQLCPDPMGCRVCSLLREAEQRQITMLSASLQEPATKQQYARSQGVCLRHLGMLVDASPDNETVRFLLHRASTVWQLISEDMEAFALKREANRRHLVSEDEEDAYLRAVIHLAGAKYNCAPWTLTR
jgi:hypothetical protein